MKISQEELDRTRLKYTGPRNIIQQPNADLIRDEYRSLIIREAAANLRIDEAMEGRKMGVIEKLLVFLGILK